MTDDYLNLIALKHQESEGKILHPRLILGQYGLSPKKSLGQNFLSDDNILAAMAACADLNPDDKVLEIGPGLGSLTHHLANLAAQVVAIELDDRFIPILQAQFEGIDNVIVIHGDILKMDPSAYLGSNYKVVANVPYYITGAILRHLLSSAFKPTQMTLTVQKEVAARLTALPGKMSILSVTAQYYGQISNVLTIKAGSFWPRPEVDSAVINLILRRQLPLQPHEESAIFHVVKVGFSQKRKQLHKNLRAIVDSRTDVQKALRMADIDGTRRAETLSIDEWLSLYIAIKEV
jgi:16S rRNA (adenine1518-N6/adenine1519-N6)-dimethyltransferase